MTCPRCHRKVDPWPLKRADVCSPPSWKECIRQERDVLRDIQECELRPRKYKPDSPHRYATPEEFANGPRTAYSLNAPSLCGG